MRSKQTGKKHNKIKTTILLIIAVIIAVWCFGNYSTISSKAVYDESKTVQVTNEEVGSSTLAIGTHLVYLGAMDEQVYEIAEKSAIESGQNRIYYKSELSNGAWYDITDSSSLADISTKGKPVEASVVEKLHFNYYTKEDGLTYELNSNRGICIFDITDPYSLESMTEQESLKNQYLIAKKKSGKSDSDKYILKLLEELYELKLQTNETKKTDEQLAGLQAYFNNLVSSNASLEKRSVVHMVMSKLDAKRRAIVYKKLYEVTLPNLIKNIQGVSSADVPENFQLNTEINSSINTTLSSVQESYMTYTNKMLVEGSTVLGEQEYSYANKLITAATDGNQDACEEHLVKLCALYNISDGRVVNEKMELQFIDDELLDEVDSAYMNKLGVGEGSEYKAGVTSNSSQSVLVQFLKTQQNSTNTARSELQFVIKARVNRLSNDKAQEFIKKRIEGVGIFKNSIKKDAFESYANESCTQYVNWLTTLLNNLVEKSPEGSEMEKLIKAKEALLQEKQEALDKNDLAAAKKVDAELDEVVTNIEKLEQQLLAVMVSPDSSESEKATARANMGKGTVAADTAAIKENALDSIEEGNFDSVKDSLEGVAALMEGNTEAAMAALNDISDALAVASVTSGKAEEAKEVLKKAKGLIATNADMLLGVLSEELVDSMLEEMYGGDFFGMDDKQQCAVLIAMNRYIEDTRDKIVSNLLITRAQSAYEDGNKHLYQKLVTESDEYASIIAISQCSGYRYVFSDTQQKAILQRGGNYYSFSAFSVTVKRSALTDMISTKKDASSTDDILNTPAGFQRCLYIPSDYVKKQFGFTTEYLSKSDYSVLATDEILEEAEEILEQLYTLLN